MDSQLRADYVVLRDRVQAPGEIVISSDGMIEAATAVCDATPEPGGVLMPGFIDIQVNGFAGIDLQTGTGDGLREVARALARTGVTSFCPTLISAPIDTLVERLANLVPGLDDWPADAARSLGFHIEGPFLNPKCRGAHAADDLVAPTIEGFDRMFEAADGRIALITLAPELDGALELIAHAVDRGVRVSLGHSDASLEQAQLAIEAGATLATHFGNAMGSFHHRSPNLIGACLLDDRLHASVIPDGIHVHPAVLAIVTKAKTAHRIILTTDAIAAAGCPDGDFELSGRRIRKTDGQCRDEDGNLAGSGIGFDEGVEIYRSATGAGPVELGLVSSLNPARLLGADDRIGSIAAGKSADLVRMDCAPSGALSLESVWICGNRVG